MVRWSNASSRRVNFGVRAGRSVYKKWILVILLKKKRFFNNAVLHKYYGLQECVLVEPSICIASQNLKKLVIAKNRMSSNDFSPTSAAKTYSKQYIINATSVSHSIYRISWTSIMK